MEKVEGIKFQFSSKQQISNTKFDYVEQKETL